MILTIISVTILLGGGIFFLIKWKGPVSLIPIGFCLAGIILILYLNSDAKRNRYRSQKISQMNLIEYADLQGSNESPLIYSKAITTANVNLRTRAGRDGEILLSVPSGTEIEILTSDHANGWFQVEFGGTSGWMYGKYLQGITGSAYRLGQAQVSRNGTLLYLLPEQTWWGKLLGLFIGISICILLTLMGYADMLSMKRFGMSWAYFFMKNVYFVSETHTLVFGFGTLVSMLITSTILTFVANALANVSLNIIDQYRMKAISQ